LIVNGYLEHSTTGLALVSCCFLATALPANAETDSDQDGWEFGGAAYLWAAGVEGTDAAGDDIDISFTDLLDDLDGALMGILAARNDRWTLVADFLYLSISQETSTTAKIVGNPAKVDVDVDLSGYVATLGAAYGVFDDDGVRLDLMAGARYFNLDLDIEADVGVGRVKASDSEEVLDGIIGAQVLFDLSETWYFSVYADAGTGDSELTWQVWPVVGYRLENVDVVAGYRHLAWESVDGYIIDDISFSGPMLGVKFGF